MNPIRFINCQEALQRLFDYLDHELDEARREEMEQHLKICRSCYSRSEFEKRLKLRLAGVGAEKPAAEFEQRIRRLIGNF
jgi:anti-sigma factor RsiW